MLSCAASRHCRLLIINAASASSSCSSTVTRLHHHQPRQLLRLFTTNTTTTPTTTNTTSTCTKSLGLGFATNGLGNIRSLISNTTAASTRYPAFTTTKHFHSSPVTMGVTLIDKKEKFDEVINQKGKLIVLDCYATWCGPCRMVAPKIEKFSDQYTDVEFYKIDVDELSDVAADLGVRAMPTFFYFLNGEKVGEVVGANPNAIEAAVKKYNEAATAAK